MKVAMMAHSGLGALSGALAALTALTRLELAYSGQAHFITALPQSMLQLLSLSLSLKPHARGGSFFYEQTVVTVAATLRRYPSLTVLSLSDKPWMSQSDRTVLVVVLAELTNLHKLHLEGARDGSLKVAAVLTPLLQHLRQLEDLSLPGLSQGTQLSLPGRPTPGDPRCHPSGALWLSSPLSSGWSSGAPHPPASMSITWHR